MEKLKREFHFCKSLKVYLSKLTFERDYSCSNKEFTRRQF